MSSGVIARARQLTEVGRTADAIAALGNAGASGDAAALVELAYWNLAGVRVTRNLAAARGHLHRAAYLGDAHAIMLQIALTANGTGGVPDWQSARRLLVEAATMLPEAAEQVALLDAMSIDSVGRPLDRAHADVLVLDRVRSFPNFLTEAECAHVANAAVGLLTPTMIADPHTGQLVPHPVRTSDGAVLGPLHETLVVQAVNARIAAATATVERQGEALTVLRYAPGQQYKPHLDVLPNTRNQRVMTMLLYLSDEFEGGATSFPRYGVTVRPRAGDAVAFSNTLPDGSVDQRSLHAGEPVTRGVKWLATRWIRARPYDPWTGPEN